MSQESERESWTRAVETDLASVSLARLRTWLCFWVIRRRVGDRGQALVEAALVIPLLLSLVFGVVAVGRVVQAELGVVAVAREAAKAAAVAQTPAEALASGSARGRETARGYNLTDGSFGLSVDAGAFERGGQVRASAHYTVSLHDLPLLGWASVPLQSSHVERIDLYRSRWSVGG